jgi:hypothetical protein
VFLPCTPRAHRYARWREWDRGILIRVSGIQVPPPLPTMFVRSGEARFSEWREFEELEGTGPGAGRKARRGLIAALPAALEAPTSRSAPAKVMPPSLEPRR